MNNVLREYNKIKDEIKNSRNFRDKLLRMTNNDTFHKKLIFVNDYFKWYNLIIFRHIQASLFQFSSIWPLKFILRVITFREFLHNIFAGQEGSRLELHHIRRYLRLRNIVLF